MNNVFRPNAAEISGFLEFVEASPVIQAVRVEMGNGLGLFVRVSASESYTEHSAQEFE